MGLKAFACHSLKIPEAVFLVILGMSSFPAMNEFSSCFPIYLLPSWERAHTRAQLRTSLVPAI